MLIFRVEIFSYRAGHTNLTMNVFQQQKFSTQHGLLIRKYVSRTVAIGRSKGNMYLWSPHLQSESTCWRGVAVRHGSPQRGGSILKKGIVIDCRTFTVKNDCSLYGGRYNRLHCN